MSTYSWIRFIEKETESALTLLYSYMGFFKAISDKDIVQKANVIPRFWMVFTASVQHTLFIYLGRLSDDTRDGKSFSDFQKHCFQNISDFSEDSFLVRRKEALELNPKYLEGKEFPKKEDFVALFKLTKKYNGFLRAECKTIRSKVFAHAIITEGAEYDSLFEKVDLDAVEQALLSMWSVSQHLLESFQNARTVQPEILAFSERDDIFDRTRRAIEGAI